MKAVMFCSIKGGVGKTMCADEFAFSLDRTGIPYGFVDIDEQQIIQQQVLEKAAPVVLILIDL